MRIKKLKREACAYIKLRRLGYSINMLAKFLGRSTSFVHRILKNVGMTGYSINGAGFCTWKVLHPGDMRKSPGARCEYSPKIMELIRERWMDFITGETDKPP